MAWLRYRAAMALARWDYYGRWTDAEGRYPYTIAGGWRYLREQVCPAEVAWYEGQAQP